MYSLFPLPNLSSLLASSSQNYANPMFREIFPIVLYGIGILVGGFVVAAVFNAIAGWWRNIRGINSKYD